MLHWCDRHEDHRHLCNDQCQVGSLVVFLPVLLLRSGCCGSSDLRHVAALDRLTFSPLLCVDFRCLQCVYEHFPVESNHCCSAPAMAVVAIV